LTLPSLLGEGRVLVDLILDWLIASASLLGEGRVLVALILAQLKSQCKPFLMMAIPRIPYTTRKMNTFLTSI